MTFFQAPRFPKLSGWRPPGRWDAARPWPWHEVGKEARVKALPVLTLKPWKQQGLPTSKAILGSKRRRVYMVRPGKNHSLDCFNSKMVAQTVKNLPAMQETQVRSLSQEDPWRRKSQPTPIFLPGEFHGQDISYSPLCHKE